MDTTEKKKFARQMYTNDSEIGKMKLQSVKENLYEATTKVVLYSIEMYTKMDLTEWVQIKNVQTKLAKVTKDLERKSDEFEQGHISMFDITNACAVINDFVREDALTISRRELEAKIELQKSRIDELEKKEEILERRKQILESSEDNTEEKIVENKESEEINGPLYEDKDFNISNASENEELENDYEEDVDADWEDEPLPPTKMELFTERVSAIKDAAEITNISEELKDEKAAAKALEKELKDFQKNGKDILSRQCEYEENALDKLRILRNTDFAHRTEDEQEISLIGSWEPEAGSLYQWAAEILKYLEIIGDRYRNYAWFDDFYASKERKDKFDECKVYVQKQIKELYVNRSSIFFEFAGNLYDKEDEEFNFKKLIENMAMNWDTGIRYLTVVTNDDMPELNVFFKECLSGTNKYVDYYLLDRNALREACKKGDMENADYIYFKLLYHLNPAMDKIYWKDRSYTRQEFARQVIYRFIKVRNMFHFDSILKGFDRFIDGIDIRKWSEQHLLSEAYFAGNDDSDGRKMAKEMEDAIVEFCNHSENKGRFPLYRKAIKASVQLYFYMGKDYVFSYTRSNGETIHWRSLDDACRYMENTDKFKSYVELGKFVDEMYKSDYFRIWYEQLTKNLHDKESEV